MINKKLIKNLNLKIKDYEKGFTLIEIIIYMGIFSILIVAMLQLLTAVFDVQLESQSTASVSQDGRFILNKLTNDIKKAKIITSPNIGNQGQSLVISDGTTIYTYNLLSENLTLTNSTTGTTDQLNSVDTTVSNLNILRLADTSGQNNTLTVSFIINSKVLRRNGVNTENFRITVGTR
ncbi:MAG: hypothetical protein CO135_01035 [Candidatus Levybacteria bacterium CG_4_9_14_3_um_filter_35_16]|nr:MAG: hypothetical protein COW87_03575 [Candidatus Levybacteria bacterium CG22_combo_CG10-13_8_21_14_all_35_11]PJA91487.1 MAG: hypothetical protein CO135_01035 [Candidatus Levybacteria bacterium CG_4_9_14_3_um_filter_35_16]PJC54474.1 MAG: hypothetical protein CO028_02265 [Candidatus Levybacteria bacterium CG_4_9_14_0_2_um_filter_35_21]